MKEPSVENRFFKSAKVCLRMLNKVLLAAFFFVIGVNAIIAQQSISLNNGWEFLKGDMGGIWEVVRPAVPASPETLPIWQKVTLPHSWNAFDAVDPDINYYQGPGWYRTQIAVNNPYPGGRTLLHFEGAGQKTEVYLYTKRVGSHVGGYDEFVVDVTDAVKEFASTSTFKERYKGMIPLSIRCDNTRDLQMIPSNMSDFNVYGGLYRYLNLEYFPAISIDKMFITPSLDQKGTNARIDVSANWLKPILNETATVEIGIYDPKGQKIAETNLNVKPENEEQALWQITIRKPELWTTENPALYTCRVVLKSEKGEQKFQENFGIRQYEFQDKGPFFLNGKRLLLRGTHRHEDQAGVGPALTYPMMRHEMEMMKAMGVNFIRLGHYQQSRHILDLCDSLGILVWEEIPWCRGGLGGETYKSQARRMLTNMISQHRNHPSIILWGIGNENDWPGDFPEFSQVDIRVFMKELNDLSHQLDPTRKTSIRRCPFCKDLVDVYAPSIWAGWYKGQFTDYRALSAKEMNDVNHFFHAEWGGDSHAGRHSEDQDKILQTILTEKGDSGFTTENLIKYGMVTGSKGGDWSETYICNLFDWHLKEQETMPWLTGAAFWTFKDFSTPIRPENPIPYVNQKGVVERDQTPKESYYVFQSYWASTPMARIYSHSWPVRWGDEGEPKMVKVYSNCPQAELFLNGASMGVKKRDSQDFPAAGLRWNVVFKKGENHLKVLAKKGKMEVTDEVSFNYQTDKWGKPFKMMLEKIAQDGAVATIQAKFLDKKGVLCLDAKNYIEFFAAGDGELIENLGTSSGSRLVQAYNGRAIIRVKVTGSNCIAGVKSDGMETVMIKL